MKNKLYSFLLALVVTIMISNALNAQIIGSATVCKGSSITLSDPVSGGIWSCSNARVTIGPTSGIVTGVSAGPVIITYAGSGILNTMPMTVLTVTQIGGGSTGDICEKTPLTFINATPGGTWKSNDTSIATISSSGLVNGIKVGVTTITYTMPSGCVATKNVAVHSAPLPIGGPTRLCTGETVVLTNSLGGGAWYSASPMVKIDHVTGVLTGIAAGTAVVSYTYGICSALTTLTVISLPITGSPAVCAGSATLFTNSAPGGLWSSSNTSVATIGSSSGVLTGVSSGSVLVYYTLSNTCQAVSPVIVNPISPITGPSTVCPGDTIYLTDATQTGSWASSAPGILTAASVGLATGQIVGTLPGPLSPQTVTITYTMPVIPPATAGCTAYTTVTVNPLVGSITSPPPSVLCVNNTITLSHISSVTGAWSSSNGLVATVDPITGVVTGNSAGTANIKFSIGTCPAGRVVTVNPLPANIIGGPDVCQGSNISLIDPSPGGIWTSGTTSVATVGASTGIVAGLSFGTSTIEYRLPTGCANSTVITVDQVPAPITGVASVCRGSTTTLSTLSSGVTWASGNPAIASVDPLGVVTGIIPGTTSISISSAAGCHTSVLVTVNQLPLSIFGVNKICESASSTLYDFTTGGIWTSDNISVAAVGLSSGIVHGVAAGTANISYTSGSTGCTVSEIFMVDPAPAPITGNPRLCTGSTTNLYSVSSGGIWSSGNSAIATINSSGLVTAASPGIVPINYTSGAGCVATITVSVSSHPSPILGSSNVCMGSASTLSNVVAGGIWSSAATGIAPIGSADGIVKGISSGAATITYSTSSGAGCTVVMPVNVLPLPLPFNVAGGGEFCAGGPGVSVGVSGSQLGVNYYLFNKGSAAKTPVSGSGSGLDFGLQTVGGTYTVLAVDGFTMCSTLMTDSAIVIADPLMTPAVSLSLSTFSDTVCTGSSVTFTPAPVNGGTAPTYSWFLNGVNAGMASNYTFTPVNGDAVSVVLRSNANCVSPDTAFGSVAMTVRAYETPSVDFSVSQDTVCKGSTVTLIPIPVFGGPAPIYAWLVNGVIKGIGNTFTYLPADGDIVNCVMTSNYQCLLASTATGNNVRINVSANAVPLLKIVADPGTSVGTGKAVTLTAIVANGGNAPAYQWWKNNDQISGATNATYTSSEFNPSRQDSMTCLVATNGICPLTTFAWVYVNASGVGVNTIGSVWNGINLLPNPNKGEFTIKGSLGTNRDEEVSLEITDMIGQVVYKNRISAYNGEINENVLPEKHLSSGMYILSLHSDLENRVFHFVVDQ